MESASSRESPATISATSFREKSPQRDMRERRRVQRFSIETSPVAMFGTLRVQLHDFSVDGAGIFHEAPLAAGRAGRLDFELHALRITVECEVVSCRFLNGSGREHYRSGLRFVHPRGVETSGLRELLAELVSEEISRSRAAVAVQEIALSA